MQKNKHRAQDERVEELWQTLDPKGKGKLDLNGLREGLDRMDHRGLLMRLVAPLLTV